MCSPVPKLYSAIVPTPFKGALLLLLLAEASLRLFPFCQLSSAARSLPASPLALGLAVATEEPTNERRDGMTFGGAAPPSEPFATSPTPTELLVLARSV